MGHFRSGTGPVRPGIEATNLAIGSFKPGMDVRLVPNSRTGSFRCDIGFLTHELDTSNLRWAFSGMPVHPLWHGTDLLRLGTRPRRLGTGPLRLGTSPSSSNRVLAGKKGSSGIGPVMPSIGLLIICPAPWKNT